MPKALEKAGLSSGWEGDSAARLRRDYSHLKDFWEPNLALSTSLDDAELVCG